MRRLYTLRAHLCRYHREYLVGSGLDEYLDNLLFAVVLYRFDCPSYTRPPPSYMIDTHTRNMKTTATLFLY